MEPNLETQLRELIASWRSQPKRDDDDPRSWENIGFEEAADQLEALLDQ